jgi:BirA family biotin operon repressor/biotin-[acetyl-CoA-carboxylase] ligase
MSVLLFPPPALRRPALLTAWAAVSVCETIRQATGLQAKIKWPNDVLLRGRKVCGILIESKTQKPKSEGIGPRRTRGTNTDPNPCFIGVPSVASSDFGFRISDCEFSQDFAVIVGIGLNVNQTTQEFEKAGLPRAGSLALFTNQILDTPTVARLLVDCLDEEYDRLVRGDLRGLESCWKWHIGLLGKQVAVVCPEGKHWGRLRELTFDEVELEKDESGSVRFVPEMIQHIEPA